MFENAHIVDLNTASRGLHTLPALEAPQAAAFQTSRPFLQERGEVVKAGHGVLGISAHK